MIERNFYRKLITAVVTATAAFTLALASVTSASTPASYPDVPEEGSHYEAIMELTKDGIVKGYENGRFGQWDDITRQQVANIFYRVLNLEPPEDIDEVLATYSDVDSHHPYAEQIAAVTEAGIFKGNNGSFLPRKSITRQQVASVLLRAKDLEEYEADETKEIKLGNVDVSHKQNVQILANLEITNQYGDYRPSESISRGAFSTMFYRLGLKIDELGSRYQLYDSKVIKDINVENMYNTIEYLSKEPRVAGTDSEVRAVDYIKSEFENLGYDVEVQPFPLYEFKSEASIMIAEKEFDEEPRAFSGSASGKVEAPLVYVKKALPEEVGDDVKGKIALIERGDITFVEKIQHVLDKGAVGVIMYNSSETGNNFGQVGPEQDIPAVAITRAAGLQLVEQLDAGEISVTLDVLVERVENTSYNVIASRKPVKDNDTDQIITIGAHHDSVPGSPGANDDASGVSAVLELAKIYTKYPIDTEVRFITFGAEERGLVGSSYYVSQLPQSDIDRMVAHFQMDMIGSKDAGADHVAGGLIMYTIDGQKNLVTDLSAASAVRTMSELIPYGQLGRSDHQPFHDVGIPAALFIHSPVEPSYHQPTDTIDKISKEKLQQVAEIIGASTYQIARPETPKLPNGQVADGFVDYPFENRPVQ